MILIPTEKLKEDMIVGKTIYRANGSIIINKGASLKKRYIDKLKILGITSIYIENIQKDNIIIDDIIKEETRQEAILMTKDIMEKLSLSSYVDIDRVKGVVEEIVTELLDSDETLVNLSEIRAVDDYTFGHSVNVGVLSIITGMSLDYSKEQLVDLGIGAILHDVGKVKISSEILNKPEKLTSEEFKEIQRHTVYGHEILRLNTELDSRILNISLAHHERYDGTGYPDGTKGEDIHEYARIVSIADVYDALTTNRVYRKRLRVHEATEYLISMGGHQFDPNISKKFLESIAIYPAGRKVGLSTGEKGYVIRTLKEFPHRPIIRVMWGVNGNELDNPYELDLTKNNSVTIVNICGSI